LQLVFPAMFKLTYRQIVALHSSSSWTHLFTCLLPSSWSLWTSWSRIPPLC
jgi:hypothetical protein